MGLNRKTVLVLGAGASKPYGLPTGRGLIFDIHDATRPTGFLRETLASFGTEQDDIDEFVEDLIASQQQSVDAFIESREEYVGIGKLAIAAALIRKENMGALRRSRKSEHWYTYLVNRIGSVERDFLQPNVDIVTLNYDRSLEYFFHGTFKSRFGLSDKEAAILLGNMRIVHVYGILGEPDFTGAEKTRPYSIDLKEEYVKIARDGIQIMSEGSIQDYTLGPFNVARNLIAAADVVCFLGFGYLPINLDRLLRGVNINAELFGSAKGMGNDVLKETYGYFQKQFSIHISFGDDDDTSLPFLKKKGVLI